MNKKTNKTGDEPPRSLLREWRVENPLPPRFQEQVWRRIERQTAAAPVPLWPLIIDWLRSSVAHPAFAVAYAIIILMLGLAGGFLRAQHENARFNTMIEARYVQSVDPYQKAGMP